MGQRADHDNEGVGAMSMFIASGLHCVPAGPTGRTDRGPSGRTTRVVGVAPDGGDRCTARAA
eukprot:scaffold1411_cov396-Prasinococcus_capsulatus_cf.AAC.5